MAPEIGAEYFKQLGQLEATLKGVEGQVAELKAAVQSQAQVARQAGPAAEARPAGAAAAESGMLEEEVAGRSRLSTALNEESAARSKVRDAMQSAESQGFTSRAGLTRDIQLSQMASTEYRRRGALTTEFISAAARGETTLAEFRNQIGLTTAKFAGWTAAAAGVYGLLDAIQQLGHGAIDSQSGVAQLQRFIDNLDTEKAQQGFRNASRDLNVGIGEVAQAQAQFARIYHNQDDSLTAARVAITATKLDNISLQDSFKALTAVANEFKVGASELPQVLAMVNAEQNKLGARAGESVLALAKSAGAAKNAGTDLRTLIAIVATLQRVTGQSGQTIGMGLTRSITRAIHQPKNEAILQGFGLDPNQPYGDLIKAAVQKSANLNPEQIRQLATGIGDSQFGGRLFVALLRNGPILEKALGAAGGAKQSDVQAELHRILGSAKEQLSEIGNRLQGLGSALGQSGLVNGFGLFVKLLNESLLLVTQLVEVFDKLPSPIREMSGYFADAYAILALMRKFNVGGAFAEGGIANALFSKSPEATTRTLTRQGLANTSKYWLDEQERTARSLALSRGAQGAAAVKYAAVQNDVAAGVLAGPDAKLQLAAAERRAVAALQRTTELEFEHEYIQTQLNQAQQDEAAFTQRVIKGKEKALLVAQDLGVTSVPGVYDRPTATKPVSPEELARGQKGMAADFAALAGMSAMGGTKAVTEEAGKLERGGVLNAVKNRFGALRTTLTEMPNASTMAMRGLSNVVSFIGGSWTGRILGAFAAIQIGDMLKKHFEAEGRKLDAAGNEPLSAAAARRRLLSTDPSGLAQQNANTELNYVMAQNAARAAGRPVPGLFTSQIRRDASDAVDSYKHGRISLSQAQDEIGKALKEVDATRSSAELRDKAKADIQAQLQGLGPRLHESTYQWLKGMDVTQMAKMVKGQADTLDALGTNQKTLNEVGVAYRVAVQKARANPNDPAHLTALKDVRQALTTIYSQINSQLDDTISLARGDQGDIDKAFAKARAAIGSTHGGHTGAVALQALMDKEYQEITQHADAVTQLRVSQTADPTAQANIQLREVGQNIARAIDTYGRDSVQVLDLLKQQQDLLKQRVEAQVSLIQAQGAVAQAEVSPYNKVGQQQSALATAQHVYDVMKSSGKYSAADLAQQYAQVLQARNDLIQTAADQAKQMADATFALRESQTDDPVKIAALELQKAQRDLRFAKTPADRLQGQADINNKRRDYYKAVADARIQDIQLDADLGKITTDQEISELQSLLHMHHLARDTKRQLLEQIASLQKGQQNDLELDVGNIRLPTTYEVRRAIQGAKQGANVLVQNSPTVHVTVNDQGDAQAVFKAIDQATGTSVQSAGRAAGLR